MPLISTMVRSIKQSGYSETFPSVKPMRLLINEVKPTDGFYSDTNSVSTGKKRFDF